MCQVIPNKDEVPCVTDKGVSLGFPEFHHGEIPSSFLSRTVNVLFVNRRDGGVDFDHNKPG